MKAFEKWAKQNMYDRTETKKAWKAALEWVLCINNVYSDCNRKCLTLQAIEQELGISNG